MSKKAIYGGKTSSDHGYRTHNVSFIPWIAVNKSRVHSGAAQDMDLFMHTRPHPLLFMQL